MLVATNAGTGCVDARHPPPVASLVSGGKFAGFPGWATTHADSVFVVLISGTEVDESAVAGGASV